MNIAVSAQSLETARGAPPVPRPASPAHVIRDDAEAIRVAHALAKEFREGASERDQTNRRPYAELDAFSQSGLWSINVPKAFGGPEVSYKTLAQVVAIISAADPSIGQILAEPPRHRGGDPYGIRPGAAGAAVRRGPEGHPLRQRLLGDRHPARHRFQDPFRR